MRLNFCTLFDLNFLSRGLALYESLNQHLPDFHLYIFAFDDASLKILNELKLEKATIISLKAFENSELLRVKANRSAGEYCWTCTPSTILYCLDTFSLNHCTYLDADLYFFSSPLPLIEEAGDYSVIITEHRYTPKYNQSEISGKYCVQFMYFKNDQRGRECLQWWADRCIEWCYAIPEDGKFGDQKYLDDWTERFEGVHELQHMGGGVAPWNVQQYDLFIENNELYGMEKSSGNKFPVVFYHFHKVTFLANDTIDIGDYKHTPAEIQHLYVPYLKHLTKTGEDIRASHKIDAHGIRNDSDLLRRNYRLLKLRLKGINNRFKLQELLN